MLESVPLFADLPSGQIELLEKTAVKKAYSKNTVLFTEGDDSDSLYVIVKGKIKISRTDENGKEVVLALLGPGDYLGEMAMLDAEPRSATAMTREPTDVMIITHDQFMRIFESNPVALAVTKGLVRRLRAANRKIEGLALLDVYGRVARVLTDMSREEGEVWVVSERLTHQDIANMVGSSREMVSIIMKELINGGYVSVNNKIITIIKKLPYSW